MIGKIQVSGIVTIYSCYIAEFRLGALLALPERSVGRDVKAHRVKDAEVPAAPAIHEYEG